MESKQGYLLEILRQRITKGVYTDILPKSQILAQEFSVNVKTMNKALQQLVSEGLLERKRHVGTRVVQRYRQDPSNFNATDNQLIEVIFEGFTSIFTHPFWGEIWSGLVTTLADKNYRPVLTLLTADSETGMLCLDDFHLTSAAGRVVLGITEKSVLRQVVDSANPCMVACDPIYELDIPQISFDFTAGLDQAVTWLISQGLTSIGFIGQTGGFNDRGEAHKYESFRLAIQRHAQIDPQIIEFTRPLYGEGQKAVLRLLNRKRPDAIVAAYDHQTPEIMSELVNQGLQIPVVGLDGLSLAELPSDRPVIVAPRWHCGELLAKTLVEMIIEYNNTRFKSTLNCQKQRSLQLQAEFHCPDQN